MSNELFADMILPLAVPNLFTYSVPENLKGKIQTGQRVVVQFGKKPVRLNEHSRSGGKLYTALVYRLHHRKPELYKAKAIENILDPEPITNEKQFRLWKWMADYYMCTMGEVMNAALPSALKLTSETKILLRDGQKKDSLSDLTDDELLIVEALEKQNILTLDEAAEVLGKKFVHPVIKSLLEKNRILIYEELKEKFKPRTEEFIRLSEFASDENNLKKVIDELEKRAFKQLEALMEFLHKAHPLSPSAKAEGEQGANREIKKSELLKRESISPSAVQLLVKKNIFQVYEKKTGYLAADSSSEVSEPLTEIQQDVFKRIKELWKEKDVALLHGVTSSGKTKIYVQLIEEMLRQGKQTLYLLPEIALTTHVVSRIQKYFGQQLVVYHSRLNESERAEVWNKILAHPLPLPLGGEKNSTSSPMGRNEEGLIVLGARSALFLPFSNLGLVIVDEEHDSSYKQQNPAPRYHARDSALMLARFHGAKVLLGTATPSIESFYHAKEKKYGLVELFVRFGGVQLPEIFIADIKEDTKRKKMKANFSPLLLENVQHALENKEQVILFQNRRGFAPYLECKTCGWIPKCKNCDVSLVYHKSGEQLRCHYCGYLTHIPSVCTACGSADVLFKNFGTEKIEDDLQIFFPQARIARMDYDSTRSRFAYQRLLSDFEDRNIDVLVGTQMVTKGLDFENVSTVGILHADGMLNFPDFRSCERTFGLLMQVSGRAGRKQKRGKVILQTYSPSHPVIAHVLNNDFEKFYQGEIIHRKQFQYPPFCRLVELTLMHKDLQKVSAAADETGKQLRAALGKRVLGPVFPPVARIKNKYHKTIVVKIGKEDSPAGVKEKINLTFINILKHSAFADVRIRADVDPV